MARVADALAKTDKPLKFVVNAGDNFYPAGVFGVDDSVWEWEWGSVYSKLPKNLPWYSVYGNHDYGQFNMPCACDLDDAGDTAGSTDGQKTCAQVQKHGKSHGGQVWHMPAMSYASQPLPHIPIEIVALDLNVLEHGKTCTWIACNNKQCDAHAEQYPGCNLKKCHDVMKKRADAAARLLKARVAAAEKAGTQLIVVSHYPSNWVSGLSAGGTTIGHLLGSTHVPILYFGAHVHSTDNTTNVAHAHRRHGWHDFCVGGGGGWACDGLQGFVVGEVLDNGRVANLRMHHIPRNKCCRSNPHGG